jgi:hypothetical protein
MRLPSRSFHFARVGLFIFLLSILLGVRSNNGSGAVLAQGTKNPLYFPQVMNFLAVPPAPNLPPPATTSYYFYMPNYTPARARNFGCELGTRDKNLPGTQDSLVILDFGITQYKNGQYGTSGMKIGGFYTLSQIAEAVEQFGVGYWSCTDTDYQSHLRIGIGTNNYNNPDVFSNLSVTYEHGKLWAQMVNTVNDWFRNTCTRGCDGQVDAAGANDIELAWSDPQDAINWVNGYDAANNAPLYNFGAAEGCPDFCGGGTHYWTRDQVLKVTNSGPVYSMPEIYLNSGRNAQQWYALSLYSVQKYGYPFNFAGVTTQYGACQQYPESECQYIDNTPQEGWTQLYNLVNGANYLTWDDLYYLTDIKWTD